MESLQELFPDKGSLGSVLNSFDAVVVSRTALLQTYLQQVLKNERLKSDEIMLTFLDVSNQGASGFKKSVGPTQVLKETSIQVSFSSFLGLHSWKFQFVGVSKRGVLYIFTSLYDGPEQSVVRVDLRSVDARVVGNANDRIIKIFNGDVKLYLKFSSIEEFSSWLRQLSDFGVTAASRGSTVSAASKSNTKQSQSPPADDPSSHRDAGETDDFSVTFGM